MNEYRKRSALNIFTDIGGKIIILILGILLPKLYVENYGSDANGLISSISNILVYVNLLEAGIGGAATQSLYNAIAKKDQIGINGIMVATDNFYKRTGTYFCLIVCVLCVLYPYCVTSELPFWLISSLVLLLSIPSVIKYFFQGKYTILLNADNRAYILNTVSLISTLLTNFARIVLILLGKNLIIVQFSYTVVSFLQMFAIYMIVKHKYKEVNLSCPPNKLAISKSKYVLIHTIAGTIFSNIDVLVLTFFCDLKTVSIYSIYHTIFLHVSQIIKGIAEGTKASFGQVYVLDKTAFSKSYNSFKAGYRLIAGAILTAAAMSTIPFLRIYTKNFTDANYLSMVYPLMFFISNYFDVIRWPEVTVINSTGFFKETAKQAILETSINLMFSILLASKYGITGVLLATTIALAYRTVDFFYFVSKYITDGSWIQDTVYMVITSVISISVIYFAESRLPIFYSWLYFVAYGISSLFICVLIYFLFSFLFYRKVTIDVLLMLKGKMKR